MYRQRQQQRYNAYGGVKERSLLYEGLKHYFYRGVPQRARGVEKFCE